MAVDDAFFFQGLPKTAIPQTLQGHTIADGAEYAASDAALRETDRQRVAKRNAADDAARQAAWAGRMAILNE
jgi:hypothetical protein